MDRRMLCQIVAFLLLSIFSQVTIAGPPEGKGDGKQVKAVTEDPGYVVLDPLPSTGQERAFCTVPGVCYYRTLTCPTECPQRKPKQNKKQKGCYGDYLGVMVMVLYANPRFVGGDGVMFYFHGAKETDFAIFSDDNLHINAHLIGTRPQGRKRDYTWVQTLSVMFDTHTLVLGSKKVSHWDEKIDALIVQCNGETVNVPTDGDAEWSINTAERSVVVERTDDHNSVRLTVSGLLQLDVKVVPIGEKENKVHNYQLSADDAFAHLETQFKFNLSKDVEGILGKTYQPGYVSPVKRGVPMPIMGGEDKYQTPSLHSAICKKCRFQRPSSAASA
ncbi:hypothetical protein K7X08_025536 [Anisodus acutangulus]|uniref:Root cap n=1 Tax=Anisodus acutangulus TaxID=402998 RepID=A0A9Q1R5X1_9SOLA|nr:hypothetical protein K7X08_025536 [Anisodus acutangulus]